MIDHLNEAALAALPDDAPVTMLNLMRFRERSLDGNGSGWDAYLRYSALTIKLIKARGGTIVWAGTAEAVALGEPEAGRERDLPAHDAVAAEVVVGGVEHVHRAALPLHEPGGPPVELRHDARRRRAPRDRVAVVPVGVHEPVALRVEGPPDADRDRLLADVEVAEAADLPFRVRPPGRLLEPPQEEHVAVAREEVGPGLGASLARAGRLGARGGRGLGGHAEWN